jgi:DNA-binding transcriptional ArsR family regulator
MSDPQGLPTPPPGGWPAWFDPTRDVIFTPGRLRGLSHPIRVRLLWHLQDHGPATASQLGRRLGQSSGVTSYHLRILAELGFVEDDPERGDGRDRWWRAVHRVSGLTFRSPDDPGDAESIAAAVQYMRVGVEMVYERMVAYINSLPDRRPELATLPWTFDDQAMDLTADEARELAAQVRALVGRYRHGDRQGPVPEGAVRAYFQFQMLPDMTGASEAESESDDGEEP